MDPVSFDHHRLTTIPGDTTAYSLSWLMKEIYHQDNKHINAVEKLRTEAEELGFADHYLGYTDAPVGYHSQLFKL